MPRVVLSVRRAGSDQDFLKWILTDARVASFQTVGNIHGDGVQDAVTFVFSKIEVEYRQTLPDGSLGTTVRAGWDQRTNKAV
jgi:type VI protein secretion system component Hcp